MEQLPGKNESPRERVLNETETIDFLHAHNMHPIDVEAWSPGTPILFVLPERARADDGGLAKSNGEPVPREERPTIVRVAEPQIRLSESKQVTTREGVTQRIYQLDNIGSRIDYFVIDTATKMPSVVRSTVGKFASYMVRLETLYPPNDALFPPGDQS